MKEDEDSVEVEEPEERDRRVGDDMEEEPESLPVVHYFHLGPMLIQRFFTDQPSSK